MPRLNNQFKIYIYGVGEIGVSSIEGLSIAVDYHVCRCNVCNKMHLVESESMCTSTLVLKRGVDSSKVLYDWLKFNMLCPTPTSIVITLLESNRAEAKPMAK